MERKIYYSFHDIPFGEYEYGYVKPKIRFSSTEIIHLVISMATLTIAFALAFSYPFYKNVGYLIHVALPVSFLSIITAFAFHEIAHKIMGQKYGYWSEYRMFPQGLLLALLLGIATPFIFAAPGAVQIFGMPTREEGGKIALAGPLTNIIIAAIFYFVAIFFTGYPAFILTSVAKINSYLAIFNLIPFGPLDGRKVFYWDIKIWLIAIIIGILIMFLV